VNFLNDRVYQKKGHDVIFDCDVQSNPISKIYWFKNHSRIHESKKYRFEIMENNFYRLFIKNLTEDDFGTYHLRAVNIVGKSGSKLELIQLPDDPTTTTARTTLAFNRLSLVTSARDPMNKTQLILSKIYNNKNKSMKNSLNVEESNESRNHDEDDFQRPIFTTRAKGKLFRTWIHCARFVELIVFC
jgi:hypothetical protein